MKRIFLRLKQPLRNERGEITFFACFFVVGIVMLISFLLLYGISNKELEEFMQPPKEVG